MPDFIDGIVPVYFTGLEGVVEMRRGLGAFVAADCGKVQRENGVLGPRIAELCRDARVMGLSREALLNLVRESWKEGGA